MNNNVIIKLMLVAVALSMSACMSLPKKKQEKFEVALPKTPVQKPVTNGAIYQPTTVVTLFEDGAARRVGDIIIVVLNETTSASKKASTNTSKENEINANVTTLLGRSITGGKRGIVNNALNSEKAFSGSGDSSQSNEIKGTLAVTVERVLPNGNLMIRGQKKLKLNQGEEFVQIAGIIRPADISASNTVNSTHVANARIIYSGKGVVADSNRMGWFSRFFNSKWFPF